MPLSLELYQNDFILIKNRDTGDTELQRLGAAIYQKRLEYIDEVIVTEQEICLKLNHKFRPQDMNALLVIEAIPKSRSSEYVLPVYFNASEDWSFISKHTGLEKEEYIERFLQCEFELAMYGFLPGFLYLKGLDSDLQLPRKSTPDKHIPSQSLAVAGDYAGIYSFASPGGWHIIGSVPCQVHNIPRLPASLLKVGDRVKLKAIDKERYLNIQRQNLNILEYNG